MLSVFGSNLSLFIFQGKGRFDMQTPMEEVREWLERWVCAAKTPQAVVMRCKIILSYLKRKHTKLVADEVGCHWNTANTWIKRWEGAIPEILEHWTQEGFDRKQAIFDLVQDQPRSGRAPTYSAEQVTKVVALACEPPSDFQRPITHWTLRELAEEVVMQGIADSMSPASVGRFLKSERSQAPQKPILAKSKN